MSSAITEQETLAVSMQLLELLKGPSESLTSNSGTVAVSMQLLEPVKGLFESSARNPGSQYTTS